MCSDVFNPKPDARNVKSVNAGDQKPDVGPADKRLVGIFRRGLPVRGHGDEEQAKAAKPVGRL